MAAHQPGNTKSIQSPGNDGSESTEVGQKCKRSLEVHNETDADPEAELREGKRQRRDESLKKKVETNDSKTAQVEEEDAKVVKKEMNDVEKQPNLDYEDPKMKKEPVEFDVQRNSRRMTEVFVEGQHLSIPELKKLIEEDETLWAKIKRNSARCTDNIKSKAGEDKPRILDYLNKIVPEYPTPVKFHISNAAHVTVAVEEILKTAMICPPVSDDNPHWEFSWWDLKISREQINAAEQCYLDQELNPERREQIKRPFLRKFTTSPAFKLDESRYGNYRFTFPLRELMRLYKDQNCGGKEPVLRMFKTSFYKQEIVYAVLVHSPEDDKRFQHLPKLDQSQFIHYWDGEIIWRAQAICETHKYELSSNRQFPKNKQVFYVWDQVSIAFHLPKDGKFHKSLKVPKRSLIEALESCRLAEKNYISQKANDGSEAMKNVAKYKKEF